MTTIAPTGVVGLLIHLAPLFAALALVWWIASRAPEGYEDQDGFHYSPESDPIDWNVWERQVWEPNRWEGSE